MAKNGQKRQKRGSEGVRKSDQKTPLDAVQTRVFVYRFTVYLVAPPPPFRPPSLPLEPQKTRKIVIFAIFRRFWGLRA